MSVNVKCKRCNRQASSDSFVLDPIFGMVVCPSCVKERKTDIANKMMRDKLLNEKKHEPERPSGWDADDEMLAKLAREKEKKAVDVEYEVLDFSRIKYTCPKCKYQFVYDKLRKHPKGCPYCCTSVYDMRFR